MDVASWARMSPGNFSEAVAQVSTADVVGTATDSSGAAVPRVNIQLKNLATGEQFTTTTDAAGSYAFSPSLLYDCVAGGVEMYHW